MTTATEHETATEGAVALTGPVRPLAYPHSHCPNDCEKPQPFIAHDGRELCGRCWFTAGIESEMISCTPEICGDDA